MLLPKLIWNWLWFTHGPIRSSTRPLTSLFWLLSHEIYLKLTRVLHIWECLLSPAEWWVAELLIIPKKPICHFAIWQNWCFSQSCHSKICNIEKFIFFSVFLVRSKSEKIESIHFAESSGLSCWETEKEVLLPITQLWERRHSYDTFVSLR